MNQTLEKTAEELLKPARINMAQLKNAVADIVATAADATVAALGAQHRDEYRQKLSTSLPLARLRIFILYSAQELLESYAKGNDDVIDRAKVQKAKEVGAGHAAAEMIDGERVEIRYISAPYYETFRDILLGKFSDVVRSHSNAKREPALIEGFITQLAANFPDTLEALLEKYSAVNQEAAGSKAPTLYARKKAKDSAPKPDPKPEYVPAAETRTHESTLVLHSICFYLKEKCGLYISKTVVIGLSTTISFNCKYYDFHKTTQKLDVTPTCESTFTSNIVIPETYDRASGAIVAKAKNRFRRLDGHGGEEISLPTYKEMLEFQKANWDAITKFVLELAEPRHSVAMAFRDGGGPQLG